MESVLVAFMLLIGSPGAAAQTPAGAPPVSETPSAPRVAPAEAPPELVVDGKVVGKRVKSEPSEVCWVCDALVLADSITYLVDGQRVPVHTGACDLELHQNGIEWLARLKPRGAFLGAPAPAPVISPLWFFAGLYVLAGLLFAALCAQRAVHTGHRPGVWFGVGLAFNAFGYLALLTRPPGPVWAPAGVPPGLRKVAATYSPEPCPRCGNANHPSANACAGCGAKLEPKIPSEVEGVGRRAI